MAGIMTLTVGSQALAQQPAHVHALSPPAGAPPVTTSPTRGTGLTLAELEQLALAHNPTLAQAQADVQAAIGRKQQAGLYPNPTIGYEGRQISTSHLLRGGEQGFFVQQPIITAGKLGLSRQVFAQEQAQTESVADAQRYRVLTAVRLAYYDALGAQQLLALRRQLAQLATTAVTTSRELFNVGQADQPDVLESTVEAQRAELAVTAAQAGQRRAWQHVAALIGDPSRPLTALVGALDTDLPQIDRDAALQRILSQSPEIKAADQNVARAQAVLARARVERVPDVVLRGGLDDNRELLEPGNRPFGWEWSAEAAVQVPIFNRNQGNVATAVAEVTHAERERDRVRLALTSAFAAPYEAYRLALETADRYRSQILPQAQQAYEQYLQRYQEMAAAYPQVLIAQRTLFQLQEEYVQSLVSLRQAAATINGFLLTDGLAAPVGPGEPASVSPGVEVGTPHP
jgi:cobalt-zinc-cadmium efflux system outer membrane protein